MKSVDGQIQEKTKKADLKRQNAECGEDSTECQQDQQNKNAV